MEFLREIPRFNRRYKVGNFFLACLVLGISIVVITQVQVRWRVNPTKATLQNGSWQVVSYQQKEQVTFDFIVPDNNRVVFSWSASTDTLCEEPYIMVFDVDGNGYDDVYFHSCRGHGFLPYEQDLDKLNFIDLGQFDIQDAPGLNTFWFQELKARGWRLVTIGILIAVIGLICTICVTLGEKHT